MKATVRRAGRPSKDPSEKVRRVVAYVEPATGDVLEALRKIAGDRTVGHYVARLLNRHASEARP